jgi:hypothetical protein
VIVYNTLLEGDKGAGRASTKMKKPGGHTPGFSKRRRRERQLTY